MTTTCDAFKAYDLEAAAKAAREVRETRGLPASCWKDGRDLSQHEPCQTCDCAARI